MARQARLLADRLGDQAERVEAAAWLHDIGYAPAIAVTGVHPLDGARYLRDVVGADEVLCRLVAHHTGAVVEAEERGMAYELADFEPRAHSRGLLDVLIAADMLTSPKGDSVDPVHRAVARSGASLVSETFRVLDQ